MYDPPTRNCHNETSSRRDWFSWVANGLGSVAFANLLAIEGHSADAAPRRIGVHHDGNAKRVIHICLCGGLSHLDSFDYKPALQDLHGKSLQSKERPDVFFGKVGLLRKNDWSFKQRGNSGLWISDLFPNLATVADELTVINSMVAQSSSHTPATFQENSGFRRNGFPVMGAWLSFGLGNETDQLPAYVVLPDSRGLPAGSSNNWTNGFLPAQHQGVLFKSGSRPVDDLYPASPIAPNVEQASRRLLDQMNLRHLAKQSDADDALVARIESYRLAAKNAVGGAGSD